ncbi:MAG TPA: Hpt domain-containing protein [Planctomycetota bacterium]|nr:Hpt domain-containing protein [Planctomycetota bacterium]
MADAPMPLDPATLAQLRELERSGSPGFVSELADLFIRQADEQLAIFRRCGAVRDAAGLARAAHTLKGSCGSIGALPMMELCRQLEVAARATGWAEVEPLTGQIEREFARVRGALEREKNGP